MTESILVHGCLLVTVDKQRRIIKEGAVLIEDGVIVSVGKAEKLRALKADLRVDASNMVATPGFVDAHAHVTTEHLVRGLVPDDVPLVKWRQEWMLPLYAKTKPDEQYLSAKLAFTEMLKTGTTCFSEAGTTLSAEPVVRAAEEVGIRGTVGSWAWDMPKWPEEYAMTCDEALKGIEATIERFHGRAEGRLRGSACIIGSNTCSDELILGAKGLAEKYGVHMNMHQSVIREQVDDFVRQRGVRPIEYFEKIGALGPRMLMTHMVHVDEHELDLLKKHDTKVVFCPSSSNRLGYGAMKSGLVPEAIEKGVCVALGCDGAVCSDMFDMVRVMHLMAGSWKDARADPSATSAEKVVEMATIDGARAIGLENEIGSLEVGKKADLVLFNRTNPEWTPIFNVVNNLVYSASGSSVDTVIVDGRIVMQARVIPGLDETALYSQVQEAGERLVERGGEKLMTRWPVS